MQAADLLTPIVPCITYGPVLHFLFKHQSLFSKDSMAKKRNKLECPPQDSEQKSRTLLNQYIKCFSIEMIFWHIPETSILKLQILIKAWNFNSRSRGWQNFSHKKLDRNTCLVQTRKFYFLQPFNSSTVPWNWWSIYISMQINEYIPQNARTYPWSRGLHIPCLKEMQFCGRLCILVWGFENLNNISINRYY